MAILHLLKPIITEKSLRLVEASQFTFQVNPSATKGSVKQAVEELFKVTVLKVRLSKIVGKTRRSGKKKLTSKTPDRKKAIVTLKSGQTIEHFQLPEETKKKTKKLKSAAKSKAKPKIDKSKRGGFFSRIRQTRTQDK